MRLFRFQNIVIALTAFALVYIHLQVQILELAYAGKHKERTIDTLVEERSQIRQDMLLLTSSHYLGDKLLGENSGMGFQEKSRTLKLATSRYFALQPKDIPPAESPSGLSSLLSLIFTPRATAEARPVSLRDNLRP